MKTTKALPLGILTITLALAMNGRSQVYQLSTPISGYLTMSVQDENGPSGSSGSFNFNFTNLTETIYLDTVRETIRQVGVISGTPSATNISFQETQTIPPQFPNPPTYVSGSVTVTLAPIGGDLSFDTAPQPVAWNSADENYVISMDGNVSNLFSVGTSYSLTTGGNTYTGSFTYIPFGPSGFEGPEMYTFTTVSITGYPNSLTFSGLGIYNRFNIESNTSVTFSSLPNPLINIVASNGFHMYLGVGTYGSSGDEFEWSSPSTVTATLVPNGTPTITNQPQSVVVNAHESASFSVGATGTIPLSYQWSLNGTNISGATSSTLTIPSVRQSDLGAYSVVVTNQFGTALSSNAMLSMYPYIVTPFTGAITYWGQSSTLSMEAWGTGPLSYQWFDNGNAIADATNETLMLTDIQFTNAGLYSVVVTSALGTATNPPEQVVVNAAGVSLGFSPTLTISGVAGYSYIIESSTNLANTNGWITLTNLTLTQPVQLFIDTSVDASSPFNSVHFYQVLPGQ